MDNTERTKRYFEKNFKRLRLKKETGQKILAEATYRALRGRLSGRVLDIGGGGRSDYPLEKIDRIVSLDLSVEPLRKPEEAGRVELILGDARNLGLAGSSFNSVLFIHSIHHLAGDNLRQTRQNFERCFGESFRVLKNPGRIFIVDAVFPESIQALENLFFNISSAFLSLMQKPMVYFPSLPDLTGMLRKAGFKEISHRRLDTGDAVLSPFTLPIGISFKYTPLFHVLIEGVK